MERRLLYQRNALRQWLVMMIAASAALASFALLGETADAQSVNCSVWNEPTGTQTDAVNGGWTGTIRVGSADMRRGPSGSAACDRGANSYNGDRAIVKARAGSFYYIHNTSRNDWGWISTGAFGTTSTSTSTSSTGGVNCSVWNHPTTAQTGAVNGGWTATVRAGSSGYNMRRGPNGSSACDRGVNSHNGDRTIIKARSGSWYYIHNTTRNDWGWISTGAFGSTSTSSSGGTTTTPSQSICDNPPKLKVTISKDWTVKRFRYIKRAPGGDCPFDNDMYVRAGDVLHIYSAYTDSRGDRWYYAHSYRHRTQRWVPAIAFQ